MKVIFAGGGSGGHVYPIIAIVREIRKIYKGGKTLRFYYVGPKNKLADTLLSQEGIKVKNVLAGKVRRYFGIQAFFQNIFDPFKTLIGILQAFRYLFLLAPDLVFSNGGYGSFPAAIAGRILRIPLILHESDAVSGLANKTLTKFSAEVFTSFPETENVHPSKMLIVGNPIRREILEGNAENAAKLFGIKSNKPVVLIAGGSQGAQRVNELILTILPQLLNYFEIIHQTGARNFNQVRAEAEAVMDERLRVFYHPVPFLEEIELKHVYQIVDFIVSRAGSGIIFEIASLQKPSILIPLQGSAQEHQLKNAYAYAQNGAAVVIEEGNLTPHFFLATLKHLLSNCF